MIPVWERYPALTNAILATHVAEGGDFYCHGMEHVVSVADICQKIAPDDETGRLAGIAARLHHADRIIQWRHKMPSGPATVPVEEVTDLCMEWLRQEPAIDPTEYGVIIEAVLLHPRKNSPSDSMVTIVLMEADRVVNTRIDVVMRHAQYLHNLQRFSVVHLVDIPGETFGTPMSVLSSLLLGRREWLDDNGPVRMRIPKAREMLARRMAKLEEYAQEVIRQLKEDGLIPFPVLY